MTPLRRAMRMRYVVLIASAGAALSAQGALPPSSLDEPMRGAISVEDRTAQSPCALWRAIEQLARHAQVRVGFEQTLDCRPLGSARRPYGDAVGLAGLTPRQAFDRLLSNRPDYRWLEVDGLVVIRPVVAWNRDGSVLNRQVAPFAASGHVHHVLHAMLQAMQPSMFREHIDLQLSNNGRRIYDPQATALIDAPVSVRFGGGTLLQALNAVSRPFGGIWQAGYLEEDGGRLRSVSLHLLTLDYDGGLTHLSSLPFAVPSNGQ